MPRFDYQQVGPASTYRVVTLMPKQGDHEFREYVVTGDEIGDLVFEMENPVHAERILTIEATDKNIKDVTTQ